MVPGMGLTQAIEKILVEYLFGSYEGLEAWAAEKTAALNAAPWLNSFSFNCLYQLPFFLSLLLQVGAVMVVGLFFYFLFHLVNLVKPGKKNEREEAPGIDLGEDPRRTRRRRRR